MNNFNELQVYPSLSCSTQSKIQGGVVLTTIVIAGVTYEITATAAAGIVAGLYGIGYAIGKGWAHYKN